MPDRSFRKRAGSAAGTSGNGYVLSPEPPRPPGGRLLLPRVRHGRPLPGELRRRGWGLRYARTLPLEPLQALGKAPPLGPLLLELPGQAVALLAQGALRPFCKLRAGLRAPEAIREILYPLDQLPDALRATWDALRRR